MISKKKVILILVVVVVAAVIYYLDSNKPQSAKTFREDITRTNFPKYQEIVNPSGFVNVEGITLGELIGKKVILVDFWTYSCINCQRTLPYLNAWYEKYKDKGLEIIGIHTPEFEFEKDIENVRMAVKKYGVKYPVVLDNDYATWSAYGNRYWPRKYLIDLKGNIVYDHIGEGAYGETEKKIQELLKVTADMTNPKNITSADTSKVNSPETYLGSERSIPSRNWSLIGDWVIQSEYAENKVAGAKIIYKYKAKEVYIVASSKSGVKVKVLRDGKIVGSERGEDVPFDGVVTIKEDRLYKLIQDSNYGQHTLELEILSPGLKAFTFTFG